jgi:hypothetical protein
MAAQAPDRVVAEPMQVDEAMAARDWDRTPAVYPSFSTTMGPSGVYWTANDNLKPVQKAVVENGLFFGNLAMWPIDVFRMNPYAQIEGSSFYLPPTYTANPPLEAPAGRKDDFSGGPGTAYNPTPGRSVTYH